MNSPFSRRRERSPCRSRGEALALAIIGLSLAPLWLWDGPAAVMAQEGASARTTEPRTLPRQLTFAHGLFRQRKFDLAAEEYRRFLEQESDGPDADDARFGLASARLYQGKYKEARASFEEFLARAPRHPRARAARYRLGELSYMLGDLAEARKALEAFVAGPSGHTNLETGWTYLGDVCLGLGDPPSARKAYERALADFPRGQLADRSRYGLGRALAELGEPDAALAILAELAGKGNSDWALRARLQMAKIELSAGKAAAAVESLDALDRASPRGSRNPDVVLLRAEALARLGRGPEARQLLEPLAAAAEPSAPRAALALATIQLEDARPGEALATLEDALRRSPRSPLEPALLFRSAEALRKLNRLAEAGERFLRVARAEPADPSGAEAAVRAAQLALDARDHARAGALAESFANRFAGSGREPELRLIRARALLAGGKPAEAASLLEGLLAVDGEPGPGGRPPAVALPPPAAAAARYDLALAYRQTGRAARADRLLAGLADTEKGTAGAGARFLIGQAHVEAGRFAEAIGPLSDYLAANPRGEVADYALADLATAQLGLKRQDEAWKTLGQLAGRFPASKALPSARLRLAEAALDADQADRAAEQFRLLLGLDPAGKDPPDAGPSPAPTSAPIDEPIRLRALAGLGRALWKLGKPAEAAVALGRLLDSSPEHPMAPRAALDRAAALEDAKKTDDAVAAYGQVVERYPRTDQAVRARLARARMLARAGRPEQAADDYMKVVFDRGRRTRLGAVGATPDRLLAELGWALADAKQFEEADRIFAGLLESYPDSPRAIDARFHLAESANQARNFPEVVRLLSPLVKAAIPEDDRNRPGPVDPGPAPQPATRTLMPLVLYRLGRSQLELGEWSAGAAALDRLIAEFPSGPRAREARFLRGEAALRQGDAATAEPLFAALLKEPASPDDPEGFATLVRGRHVQGLLGLKRWKPALEEADSLKKELPAGDPTIAELDFARGRALLGLARPDEARDAFQAVIDARKDGDLAAQAQLMRGEAFFHQDRFREALREFLMVEHLYDAPRWQAAALLEAGKTHERLSEWGDAAEAYERLRAGFPQDPHAAEAKERLAAVRKQLPAQGQAGSKIF